jgi:methyltransferase (TIGR00027 family)
MTARAVAIARGELVRSETREGDREAEDRLCRSLRPRIWLTTESWRKRLMARTDFIDSEVVEAMAAGIAQIVIVGAGYDCRALRLRKVGTRFFEVDHPVTQADKRKRLSELGITEDDVAYLPLDLASESLEAEFERSGHHADDPSLFICEGLLLYLSPAAIDRLLRTISRQAAPGSRLVLTARERNEGARRSGSLRSRLVLAMAGEPARSTFTRAGLRELLVDHGFTVTREAVWPAGGVGRRRTLLVAAGTEQ